ncbi:MULTISPECIES: hypothetical protein [unclassified Novosphingobium]|uniref:hypothetical protein n=1 Tax=unclassified Novosphingobium TaxID=2644732 RepID=UPI001062229C|nr:MULTISPECIES: hypothetical protein [unclassified Novosphingobium]
MAMDVQGYLDEVRRLYASGQTTEHSFRPALARLFESIDPALIVINEPQHMTKVGASDFVFQRGDVADFITITGLIPTRGTRPASMQKITFMADDSIAIN